MTTPHFLFVMETVEELLSELQPGYWTPDISCIYKCCDCDEEGPHGLIEHKADCKQKLIEETITEIRKIKP